MFNMSTNLAWQLTCTKIDFDHWSCLTISNFKVKTIVCLKDRNFGFKQVRHEIDSVTEVVSTQVYCRTVNKTLITQSLS